jgi:hypothetical protein
MSSKQSGKRANLTLCKDTNAHSKIKKWLKKHAARIARRAQNKQQLSVNLLDNE